MTPDFQRKKVGRRGTGVHICMYRSFKLYRHEIHTKIQIFPNVLHL